MEAAMLCVALGRNNLCKDALTKLCSVKHGLIL